jgi:hypothetical protein
MIIFKFFNLMTLFQGGILRLGFLQQEAPKLEPGYIEWELQII